MARKCDCYYCGDFHNNIDSCAESESGCPCCRIKLLTEDIIKLQQTIDDYKVRITAYEYVLQEIDKLEQNRSAVT